ncbi:MAG TPA: hypothetical protein VHT27_07690 [Solirubrobacteraceae bacterium]|jgi:hypothetical protein|nr:hypothetical protein [Solirubrobacteraceae bacterium]
MAGGEGGALGRQHARRIAAARLGLVFALYALASALLIARHALADPSHVCLCVGPAGDPPTYMWSLAWWPHALGHLTNPLHTNVVWSPAGANVAAAPMIPLPSLLLSPVTALAGPLPSYDVLALLSPAIAATAMFALCRHVGGRTLPALAGGWVYGFSSYELAQLAGHANLMLIALLPLAVLAVLARVERRLGRAAFVAVMAAVVVAQLLTSQEILATSVGFGALAFAVAWLAAAGPARGVLLATAIETAAAGAIAAVLMSPYLYYALVRSHPVGPPGADTKFITDLAGLVVPTQVTLIRYAGGVAARLPGNIAERDAYFGAPLLLVLLAALWTLRRTRAAVVLGAVAGVALLLSLGTRLTVAGHRTIPVPWPIAARVPVLKAAVPGRVVLFAWFALALLVALWLARPGRRPIARFAAVIAGIALILPDAGSVAYNSPASVPALFSGDGYRRVIPSGSRALLLPFGFRGYDMLWQAQAHFAFTMPEGNLTGDTPAPFKTDPFVRAQLAVPAAPVAPAQLARFLARYRVSRVIVDAAQPESWPALLAADGLHGEPREGVIVYVVRP